MVLDCSRFRSDLPKTRRFPRKRNKKQDYLSNNSSFKQPDIRQNELLAFLCDNFEEKMYRTCHKLTSSCHVYLPCLDKHVIFHGVVGRDLVYIKIYCTFFFVKMCTMSAC